jgi:hypothetical protein
VPGNREQEDIIVFAKLISLSFALTILLAVAPAQAQKRPIGKPSATIAIQQLQIAFVGSAAIGGGTLNYEGHSYPLSVKGLGVGGIGASQLSASGVVYGLHHRADLAGVYGQIRAGWALGDQGAGTLWLKNDKGVSNVLKTHRRGLQLALGADGVIIDFK